jgi:hypothetical protein
METVRNTAPRLVTCFVQFDGMLVQQYYRIFPSITRALPIQKRSVNGKKTTVRVIQCMRVMQLKSQKLHIIYIPVHTII